MREREREEGGGLVVVMVVERNCKKDKNQPVDFFSLLACKLKKDAKDNEKEWRRETVVTRSGIIMS